MYIILNWSCSDLSDVLPVMEDDGSGRPLIFESEEEAQAFAEEELNFEWQTVNIGE